MTPPFRHRLWLRGLLAVGLSWTAAAAQTPEYNYVQSLAFNGTDPLRVASDVTVAEPGRFLPGAQQRAGAILLRWVGGAQELLYLDSLALWNSGTKFPVPCASPNHAAVLPGAGPNGLDAIASVSAFGLQIFEANAQGTGFTQAALKSSWHSVSRLFPVPTPGGLEIHGYQPGAGTVLRLHYDPATHVLTTMGSYSANSGLNSVVAGDVNLAKAGPELILGTDVGGVQVRSIDGATVYEELTPNGPVVTGTSRILILPDLVDHLIWSYENATTGATVVHEFAKNFVEYVTVLPSRAPTAMRTCDWDGDGLVDLLLGMEGNDGESELRMIPFDAAFGRLDWGPKNWLPLIGGDYYEDDRVDHLFTFDCDRDGDEDVFTVREGESTMQTILNGIQDWRVTLGHDGPLTEVGQVLTGDVRLKMQSDYSDLLSQIAPADLRIRLRYWAVPGPGQAVDMGTRFEELYDLPDLNAGFITVVLDDLDLDFDGVTGWVLGRYQLLAHVALVKVDSQGVVVGEFPTSIWSVVPDDGDRLSVLERIAREETGYAVFFSPNVIGDEVSTGRPTGDPPGGTPPGGSGG